MRYPAAGPVQIGSGDPAGVADPSNGVLYYDVDGSGLYVALGPRTDQWNALGAGNGGSSPFVEYRKSVAFNTPGLTGGVDVGYTPAVGDILHSAAFNVTTAWDGTTPSAFIFTEGDDISVGEAIGQTSTTTGSITNSGNWQQIGNGPFQISTPVTFLDTAPLKVAVNDGSGGDPGATQGEGELVVLVLPAT